MKRPGSSDSLGALMPICPSSDQEHSPGNKHVYAREFESMIEGLDEDGYMEEAGHVPEKKRRLSAVQVKALEKNFEVENKLEPERKLKLAQELGLQPRQVAVWFQNRRARWKTKQLERDYGVLKASYDSLKDNFESLQQQNEALSQQIRELKSKLSDEKETETETQSNLSIKQEEEGAVAMAMEQLPAPEMIEAPVVVIGEGGECKDGPSESDSSAILNEGNSPNAATTVAAQQTSSLGFNYCATSSSTIGYLNLLEASAGDAFASSLQYVKMEEHDFIGEDACNFYSEDQAPTLHWWTQNYPGEISKLV